MKNKILQQFNRLGFTVGLLPSGKLHSISDVPGVTVGHVTKISGKGTRTGVTLIDPGIKNLFRNKIPGAIYVGNGFGKLSGISQVEELGTIETPIVLTNTLAVGPAMRGLVELVIKNTPDIKPSETINAIVGETNDGILNQIHKDVISKKDIARAFAARSDDVKVGNVGAGTGTRAFSWKGGIGTASRIVTINKKQYAIGVLVQTNFGGSLSILGVPIGQILKKNDFQEITPKKPDGSCMIVVATDVPVDSRQLKRIAKRAFLGMIRTGSIAAHGSGDYAIAFSTHQSQKNIPDSALNQIFLAAVESTEEAIYDALFAAKTLKGRDGNILEALPQKKVIELLQKYAYDPKK